MVNLKRFVFGFSICAVCLYSGYVRADVSDTQAFCTTMCSDGEGERLVGKDITALCLITNHGDKCKYDTCVQTDETGWYWKNNPNHTEFAPKPCGSDWNATDWVKVETGCVDGDWIVYKKRNAELIQGIDGVYNYIEGEWCKKCPDGMHANGDKCEQDKPVVKAKIEENAECEGNCKYVAAYTKRCDKTGEDVLFTCERDLSDEYDENAGIDAPDNKEIIDSVRQECEREFNEYFATECPEDKTVVNASLDNAVNDMNVFFGKKTVWRTEDGKFNTLRLASDATAGVVLGTVGGLVSAKVIKKKQLEKGYDVLNCTIGGQKMADWGDVFNVDLRR